MKALSSITVMHVSNLDKAHKYYTDILGFQPDFVFGDYAGIAYNAVAIHLCGPNNQGLEKPPGSGHVCIDCDEVDAYHDLIQNKGARISYPIGDRVYGMRDFSVDDEDGNTLVFGKSII